MLIDIEEDYVSITFEDLCSRSIPGTQNPPWQLHDSVTPQIEDYINRKSLSLNSLRLAGHIRLDAKTEIPVIVKALEQASGQFLFFACPKYEDNWTVVEESIASSRRSLSTLPDAD